jgi:hypothetical protein
MQAHNRFRAWIVVTATFSSLSVLSQDLTVFEDDAPNDTRGQLPSGVAIPGGPSAAADAPTLVFR